MEEQSHKDEMRAALRGDFERLRSRHRGEGEPENGKPTPMEESTDLDPVSHEVPAPSWVSRLRSRL